MDANIGIFKIVGCQYHTSYLSRTLRTMSVEPNISCGAILLHMKICIGHVEQNCFTSQATLLYVTKLPVILSCGAMTNCSTYQMLLHVTNLQCTLSCPDLRCFDTTSILLQFTHFCVKQTKKQKFLSMEQ